MPRRAQIFGIFSRSSVAWLWFLLLLTLAIAATRITASSDHYTINNNGSLLLPRDVAFDNTARRALQKIRRRYSGRYNEQELQDHQDEQEVMLASSGNENQATLTMVGYKGGRIQDQVNQDRSFILSPFLQDELSSPSMLMGVFDGHGALGHDVADYSLQELPKRLFEKMNAILQRHESSHDDELDAMVKKALVDTFAEIDQSIPNNAGLQGGSTASVVIQLKSKIYVANAGDSVSLVAVHLPSLNETRLVYVTREDKPHLAQEYNRIVDMGGTVHIPNDPMQDSSSRVMHTDPETGYQVGLAMSRSIGDWEMVGVIAEPIIHVLDIQELLRKQIKDDETCSETSDERVQQVLVFCISATDGLMDYISPQELASTFASAFSRAPQDKSPHPLTVAQDLILAAAKQWNADMDGQYRDDIAIAASKVELVINEDEPSPS